MIQTRINVQEYYGNPSYFSVMPQGIFDALERAFIDGEKSANVDKAEYDAMMAAYKDKMTNHSIPS